MLVFKEKLTKEEFLDAVKEGVKEAVLTMTEAGNGFNGPIIREPFLDAVREGVHEAMWRMVTNGTQMPGADFFEMIKQGTKEGIEECHSWSVVPAAESFNSITPDYV